MGGSSSKSRFPEDFKHCFEGKVIIVGAGVAGMTAGYVLKELGIEFEILEASSTHGGRIKKVDDFADFPIDLGAEWVHPFVGGGRDIPFLKDILSSSDAEFETFPYKPKTNATWATTKNKLLSHNKLVQLVMHTVEWTMDDHKFKNSSWFDVFDKRVFPKVKDHIRFNQVVQEINYQGEKVLVQTKDGHFEADKVLMTVPIQILQRKKISFVPEMPAKKVAAINNEVVPEGLKVFMEFSDKFYHDMLIFDNLGNAANTHGSGIYDAAFNKDTDKNILGFFLVRKEAEKYLARVFDCKQEADSSGIHYWHDKEFTPEHREKLVRLLLEDLDKVYDGKPSKTFMKSVVQVWSCEPHIQGSYSSMKTSKGYKDRVAPLDNKVYFAGEAFNLKKNMIAVHATAESSYLSIQAMLKSFEVRG